jgi:hypothetical protein
MSIGVPLWNVHIAISVSALDLVCLSNVLLQWILLNQGYRAVELVSRRFPNVVILEKIQMLVTFVGPKVP